MTAVLPALLASLSVQAHHSFAMFDFTRELKLSGTVREFQWTNPHCFIQLVVEQDGTPSEWSIEMGSPIHLVRNGWRPAQLKAGDKITIVVHPMRDGSRGGNYVSGIGPDGASLGR